MKNIVVFKNFKKFLEPKTKERFKKCIYKLRKSNQMLRKENDSIRAFKHDFNNIMQVMGAYIKAGNIKQLKEYYAKIMNECEETKISECFRKMIKENPAIFGLLSNKYKIAMEKGIKMSIEIMCNLQEIQTDIYEITRILGILIDNAIEAANECKEQKQVYIQILKDYEKNQNLFIIENTYVNKEISLSEIYKKNFSTKKHNTGLGLWKVKKIISKTKTLKLNTFKGEDYFRQSLAVKY